MKRLIIMRGLSGSGKSTHVTNRFPTAVVCSADQTFEKPDGSYQFDIKLLGVAHNNCKKKARKAMAQGEELVVIDNTNSTLKEMKPYLKIAEEFGYEVDVIRCEVSAATAISRTQRDTPKFVIERMAGRFQDYPGEKIIHTDQH